MKKIKVILIIVIILAAVLTIFLINKTYNTKKIGNNISNLKDYILNISSYEAEITVEITNNKNTNKYLILQKYVSPNQSYQEILEPENIKDFRTTYDGSTLKIENTRLDLNTIYEGYNYIGENNLFLSSFIKDYIESEKSECEEKDQVLIMKAQTSGTNKYNVYKTLYIDKKTAKPTKLEIKDVNKNTTVYILYNEIKINSTKTEDIMAFKLQNLKEEI